MLFQSHPAYDQLSRLADGELPAAEAMEVNGHLAKCDRCREEVDFMAELRQRLRELAVPGPPSGLLPEILERRDAGERRVLPLDFEPLEVPDSRRRKGAAALVVALVLAAASFFVFRPDGIQAGAASFEVEAPEGGQPVSVSYETAGSLAGESTLRVRAQYYTAGEQALGAPEAGTVVEGDLRSRGEGEFRGEVLLPSTVAYARFVVEDYRGEVVDRDYAERWEYLERNEDGEPTFDALWQRTLALEEAAPHEALESARRLTGLYPDRPEGWGYRLLHEGGPSAVPDAPPVRAFVERLPARPRADELAAVAWYASQVGDEDARGGLLARLAALDARHPAAVDYRVLRLLDEFGGNPPRLLAALEREWLSHGQPSLFLLAFALDVALDAGESAVALRWADRWVAARPEDPGAVAEALGRLPALRGAAIDRLRAELRRLDRPTIRRLGVTRSEQQRALDRRRAGVLASLGGLLLVEGEVEAASDALTRAAAHRWDPVTLDRLVRVSERLGHEDVAERYRLLLAADPLLEDSRRDAIERKLALAPAQLELRLDEIRREMLDGMLGSTRDRIFPEGSIRVAALDGGPRDLAARLGHAPTLVQFWSPLLPGSVEKLEWLLERCGRLSDAGVRLIAVSVDAVTADRLPEGHEGCPGFEVLTDTGREATLSLRTGALAEGVLLDRHGQIRARFLDEVDEMRAALVLAAID